MTTILGKGDVAPEKKPWSNKTKAALVAGVSIVAAVIFYKIATVTNGETRYQRPGVRAGALAQSWWDFYWRDPGANQNRCYMLPPGRMAPQPPQPPPCNSTISCVPHAPAASGTFSPALAPCSTDPDKMCYQNQLGALVIANPGAAGHTYGIGSAHGVCIVGEDGVCYGLVDQCPNQPGPPPTKTPTPGGPTPPPSPNCVRVTVTPESICVTPTVHP